MITRSLLDSAFDGYAPHLRAAGDLKPAAVLLPLSLRNGEPHLLFTQRRRSLRAHGGQVSFPGGRIDPEDLSSKDAALREAWEELAIPPASVDVVGRLSDLPTVTGFHVTPWIGWVAPDTPLIPSPDEVSEAFWVSLTHLNARVNQRTMQGRWRREQREMRFFLTQRHVVWGATAAMLSEFLECISNG